MCDPFSLAIVGFGFSALGQVAGFAQQSAAAEEQDRRYEENRRNALDASAHEQKLFNQRAIQEADKTTEEQRAGLLKAEEVRGATEASASGSGVTGLSLENLTADIYRKEGTNQLIRETNYRSTVEQLQEQKRGSAITAKSRINSVSPGQQPSVLGLVAGIGASAVGSYRSNRTGA